MRSDITPVIERDGEWFIATCPEVPGANGQGRSRDECLDSLRQAIALILEDGCAGRSESGAGGWFGARD